MKNVEICGFKRKKGITILALSVTIIILLILAGISISMMTGDNELIKNAGNAKEQAEIDGEKEIIEISTIQAMGKNKYGDVTQKELEEKLNSNSGNAKTEVIDNGDTLVVKFVDSGRYYEVDNDGNVLEPVEMVIDEYAGDLTKSGRCDGSEEKPYEINCIEDLVAFSQNVNTGNNYSGKYIKLMRTLDFNSIFSYNDYTTTEWGDLNANGKTENIKVELTKTDIECIGFSPIGSNRSRYFGGTLDGQGYEINNIYENSTTFAGLFGYATNGFKIMNLGISGNINSQDGSAGGILACTTYGGEKNYIVNCYNKCNITGKVNSTGYKGVGGIVGGGEYNALSIDIINCYNTGDITLKEGGGRCIGAGGIIGEFRGDNAILNVYNCYNIGNITSVSKAGGILGAIWAEGTSNIINCYNIGEISGTSKFNIANANLIDNCYYKATTYTGGDSSRTISFSNIKTENIAQKLNNYITENSKDVDWNYWGYDEMDNLILIKE